MAKICLSYREADDRSARDYIYSALVRRFGADQVANPGPFTRAGAGGAQALFPEAAACEIMIVLIGPDWTGPTDVQGLPQLYREDDPVHREIAAAQAAGRRLVPVLVGEATMLPAAQSLPPDIAAIGRLRCLRISDGEVDKGIEQLFLALLQVQPALGPASARAGIPSPPPEPAALINEPQAWAAPQPIPGGQVIAPGRDLNAHKARFVAGDDNSRTIHRSGGGAAGALGGVMLGESLRDGAAGPGTVAGLGMPAAASRAQGGRPGLGSWVRAHRALSGAIGCAVLVGGFVGTAAVGASNSGTGEGSDPYPGVVVTMPLLDPQTTDPIDAPPAADATSVAPAAAAGVPGVPPAGTDTMTMGDENQNTWTQTVSFAAPELGTSPDLTDVMAATGDCQLGGQPDPDESLVVPFSVTVDLTSAEQLTNFVIPVSVGVVNGGRSGNITSLQVIDSYQQDGSTQYACAYPSDSNAVEFGQLKPGARGHAGFWMVLGDAINGAGQVDDAGVASIYVAVGGGVVKGAVSGPDVCGGNGTPDLLLTGLKPDSSNSTPDAADCAFTGGS